MSTSFDVFGNELRKKDLTFFLIDLFLKRANTFLTFILDGSLSFLFLFTNFAVLEIGLAVDLTEVCCNLNFALCSSRKYPDPHHGGNQKFRRGGGVNGPGNSKGEGGFEAKFTSRWSGK